MPAKSLKPCSWAGCTALVRGVAHCNYHKPMAADQQAATQKRYNAIRDESDQFYKTTAWRKFRAYYLRHHPLCIECESLGRTTVAVILDHVQPYKLRPDLGLDWHNVRPLCRVCHNRIGAKVGLIG